VSPTCYCGHPATDHAVDGEDRRACRLCPCQEYNIFAPEPKAIREALSWLNAIDPFIGWTKEERVMLARLIERDRRATIGRIVGWLREQARDYAWGLMRPPPETKLAERLANVIELGEWWRNDDV
jgi:hypothetical protein